MLRGREEKQNGFKELKKTFIRLHVLKAKRNFVTFLMNKYVINFTANTSRGTHGSE